MFISNVKPTCEPMQHWKIEWQSWMESGQEMSEKQQWEAATILYKRAFSLADKMYCGNCTNKNSCKNSLICYLSTATKFAQAIKNNGYDCALIALIDTLKGQQNETESEEHKLMFIEALNKLEELEYAS